MTRLIFALGLLTVGLCVAPPARADFAVVRFNSIWTDTAGGPQDGQFVVFRVHHHQFDRFHTREPAGESATVGGLAACLPNKLIAKAGCSPIFADSSQAVRGTRVRCAPALLRGAQVATPPLGAVLSDLGFAVSPSAASAPRRA